MTNYTNQLTYNTDYLRSFPHPYYVIPVGGWLSAIMVKKLGSADDLLFELTDENYMALYADFTVEAIMSCGGVMLDEPLPNVNTRFPYYLTLPGNCPDLEIITVNRQLDWEVR
jgi:hypothetical protein